MSRHLPSRGQVKGRRRLQTHSHQVLCLDLEEGASAALSTGHGVMGCRCWKRFNGLARRHKSRCTHGGIDGHYSRAAVCTTLSELEVRRKVFFPKPVFPAHDLRQGSLQQWHINWNSSLSFVSPFRRPLKRQVKEGHPAVQRSNPIHPV